MTAACVHIVPAAQVAAAVIIGIGLGGLIVSFPRRPRP